MAKYSIDGITYEIADDVDLNSTIAAIRSSPGHKPKEDSSYGKRILTEGIPGAAAGIGNMALDIGRSGVAGLIGAGTAIGTGSMERGAEEFSNAMEASKSAIPEIPDPTHGAFGGILEKAIGYAGDLGESISQPGGPVNMVPQPEFASPEGRSTVETAMNFAPLPFTKPVGRIPHIGTEWKVNQAKALADKARYDKLMQAAAEEKAKIDKAEADAKAYQEALDRMDNPVVGPKGEELSSGLPYGKDRVGPQYGGSKKMDRHADEGPREGPNMDRESGAQQAFDADMRRLARENDLTEAKDRLTAKYVESWKPDHDLPPQEPARQYDPETGEVIKPRIKGPEAKSVEEPIGETIARETKQAMDRNLPPEAPEGAFAASPNLSHLFDSKEGMGAVPLNQDVSYFGFEKLMTLREFERLVPEKSSDASSRVQHIEKGLNEGKKLGPPFLQVEWIPSQQVWKIKSHEGRHRVTALTNLYGENASIPVHFFPIGKRARHLTKEMKEAPIVSEYSDHVVGAYAGDKIGENYGLRVAQLTGQSTRSALSHIAVHSQIPYYRELATKLLSDSSFNPRLEAPETIIDPVTGAPALIKEGPLKGEKVAGRYIGKEYAVKILPQHAGNEALFLHEVMHARVHSVLETLRKFANDKNEIGPASLRAMSAFSKESIRAAKRMNDLYQSYLEQANKLPDFNRRLAEYGVTNIHEFVSEGFTNPRFQADLNGLTLPKHLQRNNLLTYWDSFVQSALEIFGLDRSSQTYLSEMLRVGAELMERTTSEQRRIYDPTAPRYAAQKGMVPPVTPQGVIGGIVSLEQFKQDLIDRGTKLPDVVAERLYAEHTKETPAPLQPNDPIATVVGKVDGLKELQQQLMDTRTIAELEPDVRATPDINFTQANVSGKIGPGAYMARKHPLIGWAVSQVSRIKDKAYKEVNDTLYGAEGTKKAPAPGSFYHAWSKISIQDRVEVNNVGQALNNAQTKLSDTAIQAKAREVNGKELTPIQMQAYKDRLRINSETLAKMNAKLTEAGREPISELPHYWSTAEFDGKFIVVITDPATGAKIVRGSYLRPNIEKLRREFPNHEVADPIERGQRSSFDMDQYEVILRHLSKELRDPATRAMAEGWRRRSLLRTGMKREGAAGALGTEGGRKGLDRYEEVSESYIRKVHDYVANREIDKAYVDLESAQFAKEKPNAHGYALEHLDQARGGMNKYMENLSEGLGALVRGAIQVGSFGKVVPPTSILRDVMKPLNKIKSSLLLGYFNLPFMVQNTLQSSFAVPKLLGMAAEYGGLGLYGSPKAAFKAMVNAVNLLRQPNHIDMKKLEALGTFEASLKSDWESYASETTRNVASLGDKLSGMTTNLAIESNAVRRPAAAMFLSMLREIGYDKYLERQKMPADHIYEMTKILTEDAMVDMRKHKKPAAIGRTALAGTTMGPLQSFTTTYLAQLGEYVAQATKAGQNPANLYPLASFLTIGLLTGGLTGMILAKEYDAIAGLLNRSLGWNIPTYEATVLQKQKNDALRFGVLSDITGLNIGAGFTAPTMTGTFAPGVGMGVDLVKILWSALRETGVFGELNKNTEVEKRDRIKSITPRSTWGITEKVFTPEEGAYQSQKGVGVYKRTDKDWMARYGSTYTLDEVKKKAPDYPIEQKMMVRSQKLAKGAHLIVDTALNKDDAKERIGEIVTELAKEGYTAQEIREALKRQMTSQLTEKQVRAMGKGQSTRQKLIIQLYNEVR